METNELYKRLEEVEYLLRYYNLEGDNPVELLITAIGQMGEAHSLISKLMDEVEEKKTGPPPMPPPQKSFLEKIKEAENTLKPKDDTKI